MNETTSTLTTREAANSLAHRLHMLADSFANLAGDPVALAKYLSCFEHDGWIGVVCSDETLAALGMEVV